MRITRLSVAIAATIALACGPYYMEGGVGVMAGEGDEPIGPSFSFGLGVYWDTGGTRAAFGPAASVAFHDTEFVDLTGVGGLSFRYDRTHNSESSEGIGKLRWTAQIIGLGAAQKIGGVQEQAFGLGLFGGPTYALIGDEGQGISFTIGPHIIITGNTAFLAGAELRTQFTILH